MSANITITYYKHCGRLLAQVNANDELTQYTHVHGTSEWERRGTIFTGAMPFIFAGDVPTILRNSLATIIKEEQA